MTNLARKLEREERSQRNFHQMGAATGTIMAALGAAGAGILQYARDMGIQNAIEKGLFLVDDKFVPIVYDLSLTAPMVFVGLLGAGLAYRDLTNYLNLRGGKK